MFYLFLVLCFTILGVYCENPIVTLPNGEIRGVEVTAPATKDFIYYSFLGIPYAAPPVGNLRFKPPQPPGNWNGIYEANNNSALCFQVGNEAKFESEDCLYLNVYTPHIPSTDEKLPVLVFIYGGTFRRGRAFAGYKAPAFLMQEDIVVVTFNYRVGPFGFLSTEDEVLPGNLGLKDQQFALKWVQRNINLFGGDPQKVTIMGQSAGSASVTYQLLSPGSSGLFRAAIGNSGSALCTWAQQRNAADVAYGIAKEIDPTFTKSNSTEELLELLMSVDASAIDLTSDTFRVFAPVIEVPNEDSFISHFMYDSAETGDFVKVPVLMGFNSEESIVMAQDMHSWIKQVRAYDKDPQLLVDDDMYITDEETKLIVGNLIKDIYLNNTSSWEDNLGKAIQYFGDNRFIRAIIKFAELISEHTDLYFYQFSYHGELGENNVSIPGIGKVAHAEDQKYFWTVHDNYENYPESDLLTLRRYIKLLTNFVKYLNPTPTPDPLLGNLQWPNVNEEHFSYLDIDEELTIKENPRSFSYSKWVDIFEGYVKKPFVSF